MLIHVSISETVSNRPILWENPRVCPHICHKNEIITALSLISWGFFVPRSILEQLPFMFMAGLIAQERLTKRLHKTRNCQSSEMPGYWHHDWYLINYSLVIDDIGMKYFNNDNLEHLISVLKEDYKINMDWEGTQCLMPIIRQEQGTSVHVWVCQDSNCMFWPQTS
jgi:hypothetical protein